MLVATDLHIWIPFSSNFFDAPSEMYPSTETFLNLFVNAWSARQSGTDPIALQQRFRMSVQFQFRTSWLNNLIRLPSVSWKANNTECSTFFKSCWLLLRQTSHLWAVSYVCLVLKTNWRRRLPSVSWKVTHH